MSESDFLQAVRHAAERNNVHLPKDKKLLPIIQNDLRAGSTVRNVYKGPDGTSFLILTTWGVTLAESHLGGPRLAWSVPHSEIKGARANRRIGPGGSMVMDVIVSTPQQDHAFTVGLAMQDEQFRYEVMQQNAEIVADEITQVSEEVASSPAPAGSGSGFPPSGSGGFTPPSFSPQAPEENAQKGYECLNAGNVIDALEHYTMAINMLDTLYRFEGMRTRQPSPADAWIVDGYVAALERAISFSPTAASAAASVVGQLQAISAECRRVGAPSALYDGAVLRLRGLT